MANGEQFLLQMLDRELAKLHSLHDRIDQLVDRHKYGPRILRNMSTAAEALVAVEAIERVSAEDALQKARDELVVRGLLRPDAGVWGSLGDMTPVGPIEWPHRSQPAPRLITVAPVARELPELGGALLSVAVWDVCILLFSAVVPRANQPPGFRWSWTVSDDVSTLYRPVSGSSGGSGIDRLWPESTVYAPGPPAAATKLFVLVREVGPPRETEDERGGRSGGAPGRELARIEIELPPR